MSSRGSVIAPLIAAAAAVSGLASTVRAPLPWRPSKFRLLVLTESWPLPTLSPFIAMHIEQPGSRHSPPAKQARGHAQVAEPAIRARADEHDIHRFAEQGLAGLDLHIGERLAERRI